MSRTTTTAPDVGDAVYHKASGRNGIVKRVGKKHLRISFEDVAAEVSKNEWVSTAELEMVVREVVRRTGGQHGGGDVEYEAEGAKLKKRKVEASRSVEDEQPAELTTQVQKVKAKGSTSNSMNTRTNFTTSTRQSKNNNKNFATSKGKGKGKTSVAEVCNHCRRVGHSAKNCQYGSELSERFLRCAPAPTWSTTEKISSSCSSAEGQSNSTHQLVQHHPGCFPRQFVILLRRAKPNFDLENLRDGRVDVGVSSVAAALFRSQSLRQNTTISLVMTGTDQQQMRPQQVGGHVTTPDETLNPARTVTFYGALVRDLKCDDKSLAERLHLVSAETAESARIRQETEKRDRVAWSKSAFRGIIGLEQEEDADADVVEDADVNNRPWIRTLRHCMALRGREKRFAGALASGGEEQKDERHQEDQVEEEQIDSSKSTAVPSSGSCTGSCTGTGGTGGPRGASGSDPHLAAATPFIFLLSGGSETGGAHATGEPIEQVLERIQKNENAAKHLRRFGVVSILGDDRGLTEDDERMVEKEMQKISCSTSSCGVEEETRRATLSAKGNGNGNFPTLYRVSLGPEVLFTNQCVVLLQHYLDKHCHTCTARPPRRMATNAWAGRGISSGGKNRK